MTERISPKNKLLFPIYGLDGNTQWCMVMSMTCRCCSARYNANDGAILARIPYYASLQYPVDSRFALPRNSHLNRSATDVFDFLMTTYGNGELCSRLLYNTINRAYLERLASYYSYHASHTRKSINPYSKVNTTPYLEKWEFVRAYPPLGDTLRDIFDDAFSSSCNPWQLSDHSRNEREIQGVGTDLIFVHDHTHEVTKNYFHRKKMGANALWDAGTETGEIATAVLVESTKTSDHSHAAMSLSRRANFNPTAMYTDTWPCKSLYWDLLFGRSLIGRLGLFHFLQRIVKTLRKKHIDYFRAINLLLDSVYFYNQLDYEDLLRVLKDGSYSGTKLTDADILELKLTKYFRQRYGKHLRKEIRPAETMRQRLEDWFGRFKCSATEGSITPALGRLDPTTKETLFTADTKTAIINCKEKAEYLQDPLPIDQMYHVIMPNPNSSHGLKEYLSRRGESNLESFHLSLAHFGNSGMRDSLADNLNLTGTARHNLTIRHKLRLSRMPMDDLTLKERARVPAAWESMVDYYNHSELAYVNRLAASCGVNKPPFKWVEKLVPDNGERFFSEYLKWRVAVKPKVDGNDLCLCSDCVPQQPTPVANDQVQESPVQERVTEPVTTKGNEISNVATPPAQETAPLPPPQQIPQQTHQYPFLPRPKLMWVPYLFQQQPLLGGCCNKYRAYCNRADKRGRPPHDYWCSFKNNK